MNKILITTSIIVLTLLSACSNKTESLADQNLIIDLEIKNMKLIPEIINVVEKSNLTLNIESDTNGSLHFHGYNIEFKISKNITVFKNYSIILYVKILLSNKYMKI